MYAIRSYYGFYRDDKQYVKTVEHLLDLWYRSVGGNTVLLLNLTPDRRGLIPEKDAARLREVGRIIKESFQNNLAEGAKISASAAMSDHGADRITSYNVCYTKLLRICKQDSNYSKKD